MQTAYWLRTIVFRVRRQWDYCSARSLRFTLPLFKLSRNHACSNIISYYFTQTLNMNSYRLETFEHSKCMGCYQIKARKFNFSFKRALIKGLFLDILGSLLACRISQSNLQIKVVHSQIYGNEKTCERKKLNVHLTLKISNYNRSLELLWFNS